jgi:hypothetical protein
MKYRFKVWYIPPVFEKANEFMRNFDLWKDGEGACISEVIEFKADDTPISTLKEHLKNALEYSDCKVIKIEGGKVE